jgi:hypothetical protein
MTDLPPINFSVLNKIRITAPVGYEVMSTAERRAFVDQQLQTGNHAFEESLAIHDLLHCCFYSAWQESPEHFLYRLIMVRKDPVEVARHVESELDTVIFFELYGNDRANTLLSTVQLLQVFTYLEGQGESEHISLTKIGHTLIGRGIEDVAAQVKTKDTCQSFVKLFGLKSVQFVSKDLATQFKGNHLEELMGL